MARQRIDSGRLPVLFSPMLDAGYGTGEPCCYEVSDKQADRVLVMHLACHAAWELECVKSVASSKKPRDR